jgi:thiol-disulfide isomerase/thioredoxin
MKDRRTLVFVLLFSSTLAHGVQQGQAVPECPAVLADQKAPLRLNAYLGKVVLIDFWATWCGPCKKSMPFLNDLHNQYRKDGFEVVAINVDENTEDALSFLKTYPVDYNLAFNPGGECPGVFNVKAMPSSYLVDRQGKVRMIHLGFRDGDKTIIREQVETLLSE